MKELIEVHTPINNYRLAALEIKLLDKAISKFSDVKDQEDNYVYEYEGKPYIEDECVISNPHIMSALLKDMSAGLNSGDPKYINPFLVGKLDLETIKFFKFPSAKAFKSKQKLNRKYTNDDGTHDIYKDSKFLTTEEIADLIREQADQDQKLQEQEIDADYFKIQTQKSRRINSPKTLFLYCNSIELIRLRNVLLRLIAETKELEMIYHKQRKRVGRESYKLRFVDQINFENNSINPDKINFIDEGPMTGVGTYLAIAEFDKSLMSFVNFRDPLCVQTMLTGLGLEELRAIVHYQLAHMHILIIGVRMNQLLLDPNLKALTELKMLQSNWCLDNCSFNIDSILTRFGEGFNKYNYEKEKAEYSARISSFAANNFYQVLDRKTSYRSTLSKKCSTYIAQISNTYAKLECELRLVRTHRIKLCHVYCFNILREAYCDSIKIQLLDVCKKLEQEFNLLPEQFSIVDPLNIDLNNPDRAEIIRSMRDNNTIKNYFAIPTTEEIMQIDSYTRDEMDEMKRKLDTVVNPHQDYSSVDARHRPDLTQDDDLEESIKDMFNEFSKIKYSADMKTTTIDGETDIYSMNAYHEFKGCIKFDTFLFKMLTYYSLIYRIYKLEYFT